jgi:tRNA threonylcarbamoyladenosine biosynthesis protein TsaB
MMLLVIDTSTAQIGLALYDGTQVLAELFWHSQAHHTQELAPGIAEILAHSGIKMDAVQVLGVALGPGSFTSLRVGLALVKGLALARHLPVIGIPTLDILAAALPVQEELALAAVLHAGRGRLAVGWYKAGENGWQAQGPAAVLTVEGLSRRIRQRTLVCGELSADERALLARKFKKVLLASPAQCVRRPGMLAELAWQKWQAKMVDSAESLAPIYLHVAGGIPA